jgi:bifunctional non-homologous end joining protein LigD
MDTMPDRHTTHSNSAPLPTYLSPMLATLGELPPAAQDDRWGYEMKWDGMRAIVRIDRGRLTLYSRNDRDVTVSYPELHPLAEVFATDQVLLDGEIVAFDAAGRPSFRLLQDRMHIGSATQAKALSGSRPVVLLAFDLLYAAGESLLSLPYTERRDRLERLDLSGPAWRTQAAFAGTGAEAVRTSKELGLEGVLAKRLDSPYRPGKRSREWLKVKNLFTQEVVIGGWTPGQGNRTDTIGALLLGLPGPDGLTYVGKVGTGFTRRMLDELLPRLRRLERKTSPFQPVPPRAEVREAHWVNPQLVGEVAYGEWTGDNRLRHPAWRGLRPDKDVAEVRKES